MQRDDENRAEARLERLSRDNERLSSAMRRANLITALLAVGLLIMIGGGAMQGPGPVNASQLNIIGPNGKTRIILGVTNQNAAELDFYDAGGDSHLKLEVDAEGG